jgi:hypothetical protein
MSLRSGERLSVSSQAILPVPILRSNVAAGANQAPALLVSHRNYEYHIRISDNLKARMRRCRHFANSGRHPVGRSARVHARKTADHRKAGPARKGRGFFVIRFTDLPAASRYSFQQGGRYPMRRPPNENPETHTCRPRSVRRGCSRVLRLRPRLPMGWLPRMHGPRSSWRLGSSGAGPAEHIQLRSGMAAQPNPKTQGAVIVAMDLAPASAGAFFGWPVATRSRRHFWTWRGHTIAKGLSYVSVPL